MTWAAVITLGVLGSVAMMPSAKWKARPEYALLEIILGAWLIACAFAMWDRYL